ncbi:MAG: peptidoglycan-binding protein [Robiginitomaculum sp.]|nr:peptidoglycan-binding protein [Robiginitomaculum sp.]
MAGNGPWSVKGIDPKARAVAKEAAQRRGMTLGEWLSVKMLEPDTSNSGTSNSDIRQNQNHSARSIFSSSEYLPHQRPSSSQPIRAEHRPAGDDYLFTEIENLARRLEATEHRSTLAITGIDQTVLGLLARLEGVEGSQVDVAKQLENSLQTLDVRLGQADIELDDFATKFSRELKDTARRVDTIGEQTDTNNSAIRHEVGKDVELINNRSDEISQRLAQAEKQTDAAIRTLEASFVSIDTRLQSAETNLAQNSDTGLSKKFDDQFSLISRELIKVVAETRGQLAAQIEAHAANPKIAQMDDALAQMQQKFATTENRHASTLEKIAVAVAKLGDAVEGRLEKSEQKTEDRIVEMQHSTASALDKVGQSMADVAKRLEVRLDNIDQKEKDKAAENDLEVRLRESEIRTAELVEQALQRVHQRLDESVDQVSDDLSPLQQALNKLTDRLVVIEESATPPFSEPDVEQNGEIESKLPRQDNSWEQDEALYGQAEELVSPHAPDIGAAHEDVYGAYTEPGLPPLGEQETFGAPSEYSAGYESTPPNQPLGIGATADQDFMAAARRSVLESSQTSQKPKYPAGPSAPTQAGMTKDGAGGGNRKLLVAASLFAIIAIGGAASVAMLDFGGAANAGSMIAQQELSDPVLDGSDNSTGSYEVVQNDTTAPRQVNSVVETPAVTPELTAKTEITVKPPVTSNAANGSNEQVAAPVKQFAQRLEQPTQTVSRAPVITNAVQTISSNPPVTLINTNPVSSRPSLQQAAIAGDPIAQYQYASTLLDSQQAEQAATYMQQAANRGLPAAQYQLAKYYENGTGLAVDEEEARRWTERAANGGNRRAMHNLAMFHAEGRAAPQSYESAAKWFEEAALLGLANSQFNLALLYEQGLGVPKSVPDAYAWYAIAAKQGDRGATRKLEALKTALPAEAIAEANKITARFKPRPLDMAANGVFHNVTWARPQVNDQTTISRAQILLSRMGYSPGPADGSIGERTRLAVISYERDNGLAQTGLIDANLVSRLERGATN